MKNYLLIAIFILSMSGLKAQKLGIQVGPTFSSLIVKDNTFSFSGKFKVGFFAGPIVNFQLSERFRFQTGILLNLKGNRMETNLLFLGSTDEEISKTTIYYLEVPLLLKADFKKDNVTFFGTAGGYLGLALSGRTKIKSTISGVTQKESLDLPIGNNPENDAIRRFDFGFVVGVGVGAGQLEYSVNFSNSIANISPYTEDGARMHNRQLLIGLSYFF